MYRLKRKATCDFRRPPTKHCLVYSIRRFSWFTNLSDSDVTEKRSVLFAYRQYHTLIAIYRVEMVRQKSKFLLGVCRQSSNSFILFLIRACYFPHPISNYALIETYTLFQTCHQCRRQELATDSARVIYFSYLSCPLIIWRDICVCRRTLADESDEKATPLPSTGWNILTPNWSGANQTISVRDPFFKLAIEIMTNSFIIKKTNNTPISN